MKLKLSWKLTKERGGWSSQKGKHLGYCDEPQDRVINHEEERNNKVQEEKTTREKCVGSTVEAQLFACESLGLNGPWELTGRRQK